MKKMRNWAVVVAAVLAISSVECYATSTTYMFTNASWGSKVGSVVCDGTTDGWTSNSNGTKYETGRTYADGSLHSEGVKIEKAQTGASATSVIDFQNVRKVIVNFCLTSNGKGEIAVSIGDTTMTAEVNKAMKSDVLDGYSLNEDIEFVLQKQRSGKITFTVTVPTSSVYIRSITIKADNGSGDVFSTKVYHLVTDVAQLQDNDLIMIGVADGETEKALGYYDPWESVNNIHAVDAKYDSEREYINANEEVTYILNKAVSHGGKESFTIMDPYEEAYLVASGGKTKNKLTIWDSPYSDKSFGDYGYWDITIESSGKATIMSLGNSTRKYMQYNASDDLFGCYAAETLKPVSIYRQEEAKDLTQPMIVAPMVNFGTQVLREAELEGSKTIEVKANLLTEDINVSLKSGGVFSLDATKVDRDGEKLTVKFKVSAVGKYEDVLVLTSGTLTEEVHVHLMVAKEMTVAEAVQCADYEYIYLNPLTVTKKNDLYVYVRDETGSMLLFDKGPSGDRYAKGLEKGNVIREVEGKFQNYWGVPELNLLAKPKCDAQKVECLPEKMTEVADSADVCRYVVFECVDVVDEGIYKLLIGGEELPLSEKWVLPQESASLPYVAGSKKCTVEGIVSYDHDAVVLYPTCVTVCEEMEVEDIRSQKSEFRLQMTEDGRIVIVGEGKRYDLRGVAF